MGRVKKETAIPFSLFYIKYFIFLFFSILFIAGFVLIMLLVLVNSQVIYPADYAQSQANAAYEQIKEADAIREDMIPKLCKFVLFDKEGNVLSGSIREKDVESAWKAVHGSSVDYAGNYYKVISKNEQYCVLQYRIEPQYKSAVLRSVLMPPQTLAVFIALVLILLSVLITAIHFGRAVKKRLAPLIVFTKKIQLQELDFEVGRSNIKEIDTVLKSMDNMRVALKESLMKQWQSEQVRKEQISALAHDLKTPLTIIRGNVDLLSDLSLTDEQRECATYIESASVQMQDYVQTLIEVTKLQNLCELKKEKVDLVSFVQKVKEQFQSLAVVGQIELQWKNTCERQIIIIDAALFLRALMNVFANAVTYTPPQGIIFVHIYEQAEAVVFKITDMGKGFSEEALMHAKEQFYMEDDTRGAKAHHGIGLYVADSIIRQHEGELILGNSKETGGAEVSLKL